MALKRWRFGFLLSHINVSLIMIFRITFRKQNYLRTICVKHLKKTAKMMGAKSIFDAFTRMIRAITAPCHLSGTSSSPSSGEGRVLFTSEEKQGVLDALENQVANANALINVAHREGNYSPLKGSKEKILASYYSFVEKNRLEWGFYPLHELFDQNNRRGFYDMRSNGELIGGLVYYQKSDQWVVYAADRNFLNKYMEVFEELGADRKATRKEKKTKRGGLDRELSLDLNPI